MSVKAKAGEWVDVSSTTLDLTPNPRYGHTSTLYEPLTTAQLTSFKDLVVKTDPSQLQADIQNGGPITEDTSFLVVFGGKNSQTNIHYNDVNFLGLPSFHWYKPRAGILNQECAPSPRLGHVSAIYGDKMYVFGGHTIGIN